MTDYIGTWTWNSSDPPAATGELRTDSRNWSGATVLSFWAHDNTGVDGAGVFTLMRAGDTIHIDQVGNTSNRSDYTVSAVPTLSAGVWSVPVTRTGGSGQASNGQNTAVTLSVAAEAPVDIHIVATMQMNPAISLERYNAFYTALQAFIANYAHLMDNIQYDTMAPTATTIPVLSGITPVATTTADDFDLTNLAIPDPRPRQVILAPPGQTTVVPIVQTTAGQENQAKGA